MPSSFFDKKTRNVTILTETTLRKSFLPKSFFCKFYLKIKIRYGLKKVVGRPMTLSRNQITLKKLPKITGYFQKKIKKIKKM